MAAGELRRAGLQAGARGMGSPGSSCVCSSSPGNGECWGPISGSRHACQGHYRHTASSSAPLFLFFPASVFLLLLALRSGYEKDKAKDPTVNRSWTQMLLWKQRHALLWCSSTPAFHPFLHSCPHGLCKALSRSLSAETWGP